MEASFSHRVSPRALVLVLRVGLATLLLLASSTGHAADGAAPSGDTSHAFAAPSAAASPSAEPPVAQQIRTWNEGAPRLFLATTTDVGFIYLRPRLSFGYGKPHGTWFGVDANPAIAGPGASGYGGFRLAAPHFDIRVGARYFYAFQHSFLQKRPSYKRLELESTTLGPASTLTWETEANADIPAGPGDILLLGSVSYLSNVPTNQNVFEESLRVIVDPPWVVRGRIGYGLRFGPHGQVSVGVVGDFVAVPERKTLLVRVGPVIRLALSRAIEVRGSFVPRVVSPDDLGLLDSDFTELGLRWRWATE